MGVVDEQKVDQVFSNLEDIVKFHQDLSGSLSEIQRNSQGYEKLTQLIAIYQLNADEFSIYKTYCSNQNHARRQLLILAQTEGFAQFLTVKMFLFY